MDTLISINSKQFGHEHNLIKFANPNKINYVKMDQKGVDMWNEIIASGTKGFTYTEKGYVKAGKVNYRHYEIIRTGTVTAMAYYIDKDNIFILKVGDNKMNTTIKPEKAWMSFTGKCKELNVDLKAYKVSKNLGICIKSEINAPYIFNCYYNQTLEHVYHLDLNSAYGSNLIKAYPEFKPVFEYFYNNRSINKDYKLIPDIAIGWMQRNTAPVYAPLAKAAINGTNAVIVDLTRKLEAAGYIICGVNTDGIWYQDTKDLGAYHDENEGIGLGKWKNDHLDCTWRSVSDGKYEYIENGVYHPVVRGQLKKDLLDKPRSEWKWGDIYDLDCTLLIDEKGSIYYEEK